MADFEPVLERDDDPRLDNLDPGVGPDPIPESGIGETPSLAATPLGATSGDDLSAGPAAETAETIDTADSTPFVFEFDESLILPGNGFNYEFGAFY